MVLLHRTTSNPQDELAGDRALEARALRPGRITRLLARARAGDLDRALLSGADPAASQQLAARASTLTSPRCRSQLADGLERVLAAANGPRSRVRVLPPRTVVLANERELSEIAEVLRGGMPLHARGVAAVERLLTDGAGALFDRDPELLGRRLAEARTAMKGADQQVAV